MKAAMLIRTGSFPTQHNTALTLTRGLSRSASFSPRPSLQAKVGERRPSTSLSSSTVLRRARDLAAIPSRVVEEEEMVEQSGGGTGKGRKVGGGRGGGEEQDGERNENGRIGDYYQELLRNDPSDPLLLRNYGKFLHDVMGDVEGAEEYYGRAILASTGDGEVLSLYGKLLWETHGDEERAGSYFERAVEASPDDCYVLGSYAHFLWDTEDNEERETKEQMVPMDAY